MSTSTETPLTEVTARLNKCNSLLNELSATCCMPVRSEKMMKMAAALDALILLCSKAETDSDSIHKYINGISEYGGVLGSLYATCCTPTREKIYQETFTELNKAHTALWALLGHSH